MVKVIFGEVHIHLAEETVPPKGVVVPNGENEHLGSEIVHVNTILGRQGEVSCFSLLTARQAKYPVWESVCVCVKLLAEYLWTLTRRISLKVGFSVFFFTDVFLFPRLSLSGTR